jgi:putative membrane protein
LPQKSVGDRVLQEKTTSGQAQRAHVRAHLANERTFLAWIRTALGILAFGFLLVRWVALVPANSAGAAWLYTGKIRTMGEILMAGAVLLIVLAAVRFAVIRHQISREIYRPTATLDFLAVAFLLVVIGILFFYCRCSGSGF